MRFVQGIVYRADGSVKSSYTMPSEADIYAQANAGETAYPVPLGTLDSLPYDLTALRDQKKQEINDAAAEYGPGVEAARMSRSEEHTSELQSLMRISYAVFCLNKKKNTNI